MRDKPKTLNPVLLAELEAISSKSSKRPCQKELKQRSTGSTKTNTAERNPTLKVQKMASKNSSTEVKVITFTDYSASESRLGQIEEEEDESELLRDKKHQKLIRSFVDKENVDLAEAPSLSLESIEVFQFPKHQNPLTSTWLELRKLGPVDILKTLKTTEKYEILSAVTSDRKMISIKKLV